MTPPLQPPTIGRCSASSRSFLLGPDGPARAPPGQALRSGALMGLRENREQNKIRITESPRFEGNPAGPGPVTGAIEGEPPAVPSVAGGWLAWRADEILCRAFWAGQAGESRRWVTAATGTSSAPASAKRN
jgi:hypothetical protein